MNETETPKTPLARRALAFAVLLVAGWVLLHFIIHVVVWIATLAAIVLAVFALFWALKTVL